MGELPQDRTITLDFESQFRVTLTSSDFAAIMKAFLLLLPQFLEDFFQKVLVGFCESACKNDPLLAEIGVQN